MPCFFKHILISHQLSFCPLLTDPNKPTVTSAGKLTNIHCTVVIVLRLVAEVQQKIEEVNNGEYHGLLATFNWCNW